jgi:hypothetical protein
MHDVRMPFRGEPPDRDVCVVGQSSRFNPQLWRQALPPGLWPPELDSLGERDSSWSRLDRADVFSIGRPAAAPDGATHTYIAASVWGTGTRALGVSRRTRPFTGDANGTVGQRLADAVRALLDPGGGPVKAYDLLHGSGEYRVEHIGPSFGTKTMYFAGFGKVPGQLQPLILDRNVARALNLLCGTEWPMHRWATWQYRAYLELAHDWAQTWGALPDVVERVLFAVGKSDPLAVKAFMY